MTEQNYHRAESIRRKIEDFKTLRDITCQPYNKYSLTKTSFWLSSYDERKVCLCDKGLAEVVREYCDRRIKELQEEFESL